MSSFRQAFEALEPTYKDCFHLYQKVLSFISGQDSIFNTITLTMLKNQINDHSVNTIKEAIQKRMSDLKPADVLCSPQSVEGGLGGRSNHTPNNETKHSDGQVTRGYQGKVTNQTGSEDFANNSSRMVTGVGGPQCRSSHPARSEDEEAHNYDSLLSGVEGPLGGRSPQDEANNSDSLLSGVEGPLGGPSPQDEANNSDSLLSGVEGPLGGPSPQDEANNFDSLLTNLGDRPDIYSPQPLGSDNQGSVRTATDGDSAFDNSSDVTFSFDSARNRQLRKPLPSISRKLRVLIAGDINVGKTSVMNLFLGDNYLPAYSGKCTTVPCEVHNSTHRFVRVYYKDKTMPYTDIPLAYNKSDQKWQDIGMIVHEGTYDGNDVRRLLLFWPLQFVDDQASTNESGHESGFGSLNDTVRDPGETTPKTVADDDPHQTRLKQIVNASDTTSLPIVFLDLPGVSDNESGVDTVLENIPDFHLFIFVLDIGGEPVRKTFENMLENVKEKITKHGIDFNPESALFLLNRSDQYHRGPNAKRIEQMVLSAIKPQWPNVEEEQLFRLSCTKIQCAEERKERFLEKVCKFLENANRMNLEEHFLWLINLLDAIQKFFEKDDTWVAYEKCLAQIKEFAKGDNDFLDEELHLLDRRESSFCKGILAKAKDSEEKLRNYIKEQTSNNIVNFGAKLKEVMRSEKVDAMRKDFDLTVKTLLKTHRERLKQNVKLVEYLEKQNKKTVDMNDVLNAIATLVSIPFASVALLGRSVSEEIEMVVSDPKEKKISRRTQCFLQEAEAAIQAEIEFIDSQQYIRHELLSFKSMQNKENDKPDLTDLHETLRLLWKIYTQNVLKHDFTYDDVRNVVDDIDLRTVSTVRVTRKSGPEIFVRKCLKSELVNDESTSASLPRNFNMYRELVVMRSLYRKNSENCIRFCGSACWTEGTEYILAVLMEKSGKSLSHLIKNYPNPNLSSQRRIALAFGAAKGLNCLHQSGYIHRQVRPRHFLISLGQNDNEKDSVKICDFSHTHEDETPARTDKAYYAPEIFRQGAKHSMTSDVYSLGLVFWELCLWRKIKCMPGEPPSIREVPSGEFKTVLKACLDVKPERRPTTHMVVRTLSRLVGSN
ncbi:uncharacterized protein [Argopecten irradians]|uniref:uncharacterized protein n=1 Tax=Argopecten irradians TaxID=31199 RepID=UPI00371BDCAF